MRNSEKNKLIDISASPTDIWRVLNDNEHKLLRENARFVNLKKNEIVYYENDKPRDLMCLLKGKIKISGAAGIRTLATGTFLQNPVS